MPLSNEKHSLNDDLNSDIESSERSDSVNSSSDYECTRQSFSSDSSSKPSSPASSPPKIVSFDDLMETARGLSNMTLAHEIVMNANFQIKPVDLPPQSLERRVKEIVHKAFWDCLEAELNQDPPEYGHALLLLGEIKEILLSFFIPGQNRLRNQICEVLDLDLIRQEAENNAIDLHKLADYVVTIMGKLCAPVRDDDVKKLKSLFEPVPLFRDIFHVLDLMTMDLINFTIQNIRPHVQQCSVGYERSKFQDFLNKQPNALDYTTLWLKECIAEVSASMSSSDPSPTGTGRNPNLALSPSLVLNNGYVKLLQWDFEKKPLPETLLSDESRLQELQQRLNEQRLVATLMLIIYNMVGATISGLPGFADELKTVINVLLDGMQSKTFNMEETLMNISVKVCSEINTSLTERGYPALSADSQINLTGQICSINQENNSVRNLINNRIELYIKNLISASSAQKSASVVLGGLAPIQAELEEIGSQYASIVKYNIQVYGPFYSGILRKLLFNDLIAENTASTST
ncbi:T-complex protein 11-like protein 2 isoform X1 [Callorhinchus milii]|uniref:T-complex protein 11-like protein 2 isoform X1 n=2 Tax=Callorhinchus milii TaxID=7868 RepID=UPI001C3FB2EC|nr:T-complex protein 11-like protein 2 isoform X1 [Callorhinchus milii]XP_042190717.1 T-complex protein 11-like protein 2 isoform X1 [Callorhinchus milii]XP_042190718.1 T-complex protein 11-like protein 2 isoform X1 [Callorhinchus milii]